MPTLRTASGTSGVPAGNDDVEDHVGPGEGDGDGHGGDGRLPARGRPFGHGNDGEDCDNDANRRERRDSLFPRGWGAPAKISDNDGGEKSPRCHNKDGNAVANSDTNRSLK